MGDRIHMRVMKIGLARRDGCKSRVPDEEAQIHAQKGLHKPHWVSLPSVCLIPLELAGRDRTSGGVGVEERLIFGRRRQKGVLEEEK